MENPRKPINRIAFINRDGELCTIAPDGSSLHVLTNDQQFYQFPAWSPDGQLVAAIGSSRRTAEVLIANDRTGNIQQMYASEDGTPIYLYWNPDGTTLSYIAAEAGRFGLHFSHLDGSHHIRAYGQPFFWSFSPSGETLLVHNNGSGEYGQLRILEREGQGEAVLGTPGLFQTPHIAPNGKYLAYATLDPLEGARLLLTTTTGEHVTSLAHNGIIAFAWSPTCEHLAFIHPVEQIPHWYGPLQTLELATGTVRLLVDEPILAFFWSPDGSALAYFSIAQDSQQRDRDFPATHQLTSARAAREQTDAQLVLSIGVVDLADGNHRRLGRFSPQPLFVNQFLPFFDQYSRSHQIWSPDSQSLVIPVMARGIPQIAIIPRNGDRARILFDGGMPFWSTC